MSLDRELIGDLHRFHRKKSSLLGQVRASVDEVEDHDARVRRELIDLCRSFHSDAEAAHHHNEELLLESLRTTEAPVHNRIEHISAEHRSFHQIVERLLAMLGDPGVEPAIIAAEIRWFMDLYEHHATNEEAIFFPMARKYIEEPDWVRIEVQWRR